jgi:Ca2+-binding RTX toxin-like protein
MPAPVLWGSELLVNTFTQDSQVSPGVIQLKDGSFLAVWAQKYADNTSGIRGQIFFADGTKKGGEFLITPDVPLAEDTAVPRIALLSDGRFVVTWMDDSRRPGEDKAEIRARIYSATGVAEGDDFLVNSVTNGPQWDPKISALSNGGFVVTFYNAGTSQLAARGFDHKGDPLGDQVTIDPLSWGASTVVGLKNGNYAVFYEHVGTGDPSGRGVFGRIMTADGQPAPGTQEFVVPTSMTGNQMVPAAALLEDGRMVVVWMHHDQASGDGSDSCIMGQILNPDGSRSGREFRVNVKAQEIQDRPAVAALAGGGFAVAFEDYHYSAADINIRLVTFDRSGTRTGDEIQVNTGVAGNQIEASLTALADGRILVSWTDWATGRLDDPSRSVRSQIVDPRATAQTSAGTGADDQFAGTIHGDDLSGGAGVDRLWGYHGNDTLDGGAGADVLSGGEGFDFVSFASAATGVTASLSGASGDGMGDTWISIEGIIGSSHADRFTGNGATQLQGGAGNDTYQVQAGDAVAETAGGGRDTVQASSSYALAAGAEVEVLQLWGVSSRASYTLTGSDTANEITGHAGTNLLQGQGGHDVLKASLGNDRVYGGTGNDKVYGGAGNDRLYGEAGRDIFVFDTRTNKRTNVDKIYDFKFRDDSIYLENAVFTKLGSGSFSKPKQFKADMFTTGTKAKDAEDRIVYDKKTGALYYDQDGTGSKAQVKIATLTNKATLKYSDFFVI